MASKFNPPQRILVLVEGGIKQGRWISGLHAERMPRPAARVDVVDHQLLFKTYSFIELQLRPSKNIWREYATTGRVVRVDFEVVEEEYPKDFIIAFRAEALEGLENDEEGSRSINGRWLPPDDQRYANDDRERHAAIVVLSADNPGNLLSRLSTPEKLAEHRAILLANEEHHLKQAVKAITELSIPQMTTEERRAIFRQAIDGGLVEKLKKQLSTNKADAIEKEFGLSFFQVRKLTDDLSEAQRKLDQKAWPA